MRSPTPRTRDDFDREGTSVAWPSPDGGRCLISGSERGYALRSPDDRESDDEVAFEADVHGKVYFPDEPVGWKIPAPVLRQTCLRRMLPCAPCSR